MRVFGYGERGKPPFPSMGGRDFWAVPPPEAESPTPLTRLGHRSSTGRGGAAEEDAVWRRFWKTEN